MGSKYTEEDKRKYLRYLHEYLMKYNPELESNDRNNYNIVQSIRSVLYNKRQPRDDYIKAQFENIKNVHTKVLSIKQMLRDKHLYDLLEGNNDPS